MKTPNSSIIDNPWPKHELEVVNSCPYCDSKDRSLIFKNVQDWSFYCAPGKWNYWSCYKCSALYLNPRPMEKSIGKAYGNYYTHEPSNTSLRSKIKNRLRNECFSHWFGIDINPRLNIPKFLGPILNLLKILLHAPYELETLVKQPKGKLLDVGCGSGNMLEVAKQIGWDVTGLEVDKSAVYAARMKSLNVIEGDFRKLKQHLNVFDCIVCSHVLEHVHTPLDLLSLLSNSLKPGGVLLLSLPNAKSHLRTRFGINWRGLEAPRHISIPMLEEIIKSLTSLGFVKINQNNIYGATLQESIRIEERKHSLSSLRIIFEKLKYSCFQEGHNIESDFIQLTAYKKVE